MQPTQQIAAINEFLAAPKSGVPEFVEIINLGPIPLILGDLILEDARGTQGHIATTGSVAPGAMAVLTPDKSALDAFAGNVSSWEVNPWPTLNNTGDDLRLLSLDRALDSLSYRSSHVVSGVSRERINPSAPAASQDNWALSVDPSGATPGRTNSAFLVDIEAPFVVSAEYISPDSLRIAFSEPVRPTSLQAGAIQLDGVSTSGYSFPLPFTDLWLQAPCCARNIALGPIADFSGNATVVQYYPIAQSPRLGELILSELMIDPLTKSDGTAYSEFVEISSRVQYAVSLSGVSLVIGGASGSGESISLYRRGFTLGPFGHAVVYAEPVDAWNRDPEARGSIDEYQGVDGARFARIPAPGKSLGLNNAEDRVDLFSKFEGLLDQVTYRDDWNDRAFTNTKGRSLERTRLNTDPRPELSWSTNRSASGVSIGASNVAPVNLKDPPRRNELLISEIMYDPVGDEQDGLPDQTEYVEFVNASRRSLDLNGTYLIRTNGDGSVRDSIRLVYEDVALGPGDRAVSFWVPSYVEDGQNRTASFLSGAFPNALLDRPVLLPNRQPLGLANNGASLALHSRDGRTADSVNYQPEWHHFLVLDGRGSALERIDESGGSNTQSNWTTSVSPTGGTPGSRNSVAVIPNSQQTRSVVEIEPKTFSPNGDGFEDVARIAIRTADLQGAVRIRLFDLDGRQIFSPVSGDFFTENATYYWDGRSESGRMVEPGIYIVLVDILDAASLTTRSFKKPVAVIR